MSHQEIKTTELPRELWYGDGEPHDPDVRILDERGRPASLWSAVLLMPRDEWAVMARQLWRLRTADVRLLMAEAVIARIMETDIARAESWAHEGDPSGRVTVWVDEERRHSATVWARLTPDGVWQSAARVVRAVEPKRDGRIFGALTGVGSLPPPGALRVDRKRAAGGLEIA